MINRRLIAHRNVELTLAALFLLVLSLTVHIWVRSVRLPTRPIRLIVPFAPGGGADISGRTIASKLTDRLQQQVVVDNRPGAGGNIGTELVAKANADGYTLLLASSSYGANPSLYKLSVRSGQRLRSNHTGEPAAVYLRH